MEAPMAVRMSGPLTTYLPGFRAELAGQGYQPGARSEARTNDLEGGGEQQDDPPGRRRRTP